LLVPHVGMHCRIRLFRVTHAMYAKLPTRALGGESGGFSIVSPRFLHLPSAGEWRYWACRCPSPAFRGCRMRGPAARRLGARKRRRLRRSRGASGFRSESPLRLSTREPRVPAHAERERRLGPGNRQVRASGGDSRPPGYHYHGSGPGGASSAKGAHTGGGPPHAADEGGPGGPCLTLPGGRLWSLESALPAESP
jgi:hypothetical protein